MSFKLGIKDSCGTALGNAGEEQSCLVTVLEFWGIFQLCGELSSVCPGVSDSLAV